MIEARRQFVGIGFGPIQSGLFLYEAQASGRFSRFTVADVDDTVVQAVRSNQGCYMVNVAGTEGISRHVIENVRTLNPRVDTDREELKEAIATADEIATALPSVSFFEMGGETSPAACLADGLARRASGSRPVVIYTAENHNHAAEILEKALAARFRNGRLPDDIQVLNTVIGKMSGIITDEVEQQRLGLALFTPALPRAVLVEAFNRILITHIRLEGFSRGLSVFEEKADLLPFEEAKLYGHNAVHALLGYLAHDRGLHTMAEAGQDAELMEKAKEAFLRESAAGLLHRYAGTDPLFTPAGFQSYAKDLLTRMTSPYLCDPVARVIRDPMRKLGWDDRLVGAMRLALQAGVEPRRFAEGARLAASHCVAERFTDIWPEDAWRSGEAGAITRLMGIS